VREELQQHKKNYNNARRATTTQEDKKHHEKNRSNTKRACSNVKQAIQCHKSNVQHAIHKQEQCQANNEKQN
jgi:hypothetical protein